ncbi:CDP-glycerol glycerophosphotransferase family protein [Thioalkalivibrio sp. AKL7]|uniref:CDP-glycerol glycerophosphotransferase family protein n=1 Tax=Thioalkalivibrio sp. AKL7 TaxID=1158155 RepID=UPI000370A4BB|nr:CDP-glycerol glycerophosphotransferase family protein [Thioalkalivibrio sp. AKL7]
MKIDKRKPSHWLYLSASAFNVLAAILIRPLLKLRKAPSPPPPTILLYGHKLNGNLLALYNAFCTRHPEMDVRFLTLDPLYQRELRSRGTRSTLLTAPAASLHLARAHAIISDHGLHTLQPLLALTDIRFFDVWHGIPFKGFDADDFRTQHRYDEVWVASPLHRELYTDRFGFDSKRVVATGYPRTDRLLQPESTPPEIRERLGLPVTGPLILFAPTWAQDDAGRAIYPFGHDEETFLEALTNVATHHNATILLRPHLNTRSRATAQHPHIRCLPSDKHPDTEEILLVSDVLICDWSSIAFDYLLLSRPTIFLDVPAPFRKGFSLGPEYRFGPIVHDLERLTQTLEEALATPDRYWRAHREQHTSTQHAVYRRHRDGKAADRCIERLQTYLAMSESSR